MVRTEISAIPVDLCPGTFPEEGETPFHSSALERVAHTSKSAFRYARHARTTVARSVHAARFRLRVALPAAPLLADRRARPGRAYACPPSTITRHAKPGFAIAWTAMVDPQSAARTATVRSSGVFCAVVCSCRRPPLRRRAPRAGQQRISTPHTLIAARWSASPAAASVHGLAASSGAGSIARTHPTNHVAYAAACSRNGGTAATASTSPPPAVRTATSLAAPCRAPRRAVPRAGHLRRVHTRSSVAYGDKRELSSVWEKTRH